MKKKSILLTSSLLLLTSAANAAVPQRWTVETSRVQPVVFEAIHGETLALEATFKSYGEPVEMPLNGCSILWQTNGMGSAWWQAPATVERKVEVIGVGVGVGVGVGGQWNGSTSSTNWVVKATFTPAMDPGAASVVGFLGATGQNYRAAFTIRFRHGPGERPNTIAGPVPILDLAHTTVINPPWPTEADFAATTTVMKAELKGYVDEQIEGAGLVTPQAVTNAASAVTSNVVTKTYVEGLGVSAGLTTNDVNAIIGSSNLASTASVALKRDKTDRVWTPAGFTPWTATGVPQGWTLIGQPEIVGYEWHWLCMDDNGNRDFFFTSTYSDRDLIMYNANMMTHQIHATREYHTADNLALVSEISSASITNIGALVAATNMVERIGFIKSETDPTVPAWAKAANPPASMPDNGLILTNDAVKTKSGTAITASHVGAADAATVNQMGQSLAAVSGHLNAEDARFVSTNYDSVVRTPEAYVEIKINNNWQTIWKEMTRWGKFVGNAFNWNTWQGFHAWSTNVMAQLETKAERCWGIYDSETGEISPDGYTQISSSNILIAANMSYKRVVDTANAIWVLESNSGLATLGGTNGYFRVKDGDGNTQFEIIKGNLRELGCDAGGITVDDEGATPVLTIPYSVAADSHPTLKICTDLTTADWKAESEATCAATVSWSGSSGAYVATVTAKSNSSKMFIKATYMGGSETIINNIAPTKLQYIYIGNTKYAVGYTTINGTGVMTLTPQ